MTCAMKSRSRQAFTLIELLVVLAIIGLLVSITAGTAFFVLGYQKSNNTETTLRTLDTALRARWKAVIEQANKEDIPQSIYSFAGSDWKRARVIWIKLRLRQEFPLTWAEALNPAPLTAKKAFVNAYNDAYQRGLTEAGVANIPAPPYPTLTVPQNCEDPSLPNGICESSTLLYIALQAGQTGVGFDPDSLGSAVADGYYYPPLPSGVNIANPPFKVPFKQFVDAWRMPLAFYRWPTANTELDATNAARPGTREAIFRDDQDADGTLLNPTWWGTPSRVQFEAICHSVSDASGMSPRAYFAPRVITSRGRNNKLGLTLPATAPAPDPMQADATNDSQDNIDSYRLREGARGD